MLLKSWEELPDFMRVAEVRPYWEILNKKRGQLILKRIFDLIVSLILLLLLAIPMAVIAILIKRDSPGSILYRQERVTSYGKHFRIHKFRTMVSNAEKIGTSVTVGHDSRITKLGAKLRGLRIDELPQVINVLKGDMSLVGPRPYLPREKEDMKYYYYYVIQSKPGITGFWQVNGRSEVTFNDRLWMDLDYYKNSNLGTDIKLLAKTGLKVLKKEGAT